MTDLTILLPVLLVCGITALFTSLGWCVALERTRAQLRAEKAAHADTTRIANLAIDRWSESEVAHKLALADLAAANVSGAERDSRRRHPSSIGRSIAAAPAPGLRVVR